MTIIPGISKNSNRMSEDMDQKISRKLTVLSKLGIHARPAAMIVRIASKFKCSVWIDKDGEEVNGKSIMGIMMLAAGEGSVLTFNCEGEDSNSMLDEMEELFNRKFEDA